MKKIRHLILVWCCLVGQVFGQVDKSPPPSGYFDQHMRWHATNPPLTESEFKGLRPRPAGWVLNGTPHVNDDFLATVSSP
jgi:hypothetical protein